MMPNLCGSANPILKLEHISREYVKGGKALRALDDVSLHVAAGEMVAIIGSSGSGKSTLLNIIGCLDRPTAGSYAIESLEISDFDHDDIAVIRRRYFGFIFQRYHLLADLTAYENIELPAIYAGESDIVRRDRIAALADRFGIGHRLSHRPAELSGGQQQRVSIARSLMNGGQVILADEPTGALDRKNGDRLMHALSELNAAGHTIIFATHDPAVARHATRVITIEDGKLVSDVLHMPRARRTENDALALEPGVSPSRASGRNNAFASVTLQRSRVAILPIVRFALTSVVRRRMHLFLSILGISIGIAAVVCANAIGEASRQRIVHSLQNVTPNTIEIYPERFLNPAAQQLVRPITMADLAAVTAQDGVEGATPVLTSAQLLRSDFGTVNATLDGVDSTYAAVNRISMLEGRFFSTVALQRAVPEAVLDTAARTILFGRTPAVGHSVLAGATQFLVVGVAKQGPGVAANSSPTMWIADTAYLERINPTADLDSIAVRPASSASVSGLVASLTSMLVRRHQALDFRIFDTDTIRAAILSTDDKLKGLIVAMSAITLVIAGVGVMNMMLTSVSERTNEIGVRVAIGARRLEIQLQFLFEAIFVCLCGGIVGLALAYGANRLTASIPQLSMIFSMDSIVIAFIVSSAAGIVFGSYPAFKAARLDPVKALADE